MVTQQPTDQNIIRDNSLVELERLFNKRILLKNTLGSLVPGINEAKIQDFHEVLEIGCGPGSWVLEMAQSYYASGIQVMGIDSNTVALAYARKQAANLKLDNTIFLQVDHLSGPFTSFPSGSFDLISAQFLNKKLFPQQWAGLFHECRRLLKPGGMLRVTEFEMGISNAPAHEELIDLWIQAMRVTGRSLSPTNRHLGLLCELLPMLQEARFHHTVMLSTMINYSKGAPMHTEWVKDYLIMSQIALPLLVELELVTQERAEMLSLQQIDELDMLSFHAILPVVTVWGTK